MKHLLLAAVVLSTPAPALAEDIRAYVREGNDLYYYGDKFSEATVMDMLGDAALSDTFGLPKFIISNPDGSITPSFGPDPHEIELLYGGDGKVDGEREELEFAEDEGTDVNEDMTFAEDEAQNTADDLDFGVGEGLSVVEEEDGPTDFFAGDSGPAITPQDGTWQVTLTNTSATGCPPGVAEQARARLAQSATLDVTFSRPKWHPSDFGPDLARYDWRPVGRNGYFSYPYSTGEEASGSGLSLSISAAYRARSETRIDAWYRIRLNLAPELAAMAASSERCEVIIEGELSK